MVQTRKNVRLTKPKVPLLPPSAVWGNPAEKPEPLSNELHIQIEPISKLYTDDTRRFPERARSGNQYIMITYHCDSNAILAAPFKSRVDRYRLIACNVIT
jgi:hypothetical protein